jgi:hypothetical protein
MGKRLDTLSIIGLILVFIVLYYPVWITDYVYTDEAVQLWHYGKTSSFRMFVPQGRYITDKLMLWSFGNIHQIEQLKFIRIFSFLGWLFAIPIWYHVLKAVLQSEGLPVLLAFVCTLYLVCMPPLTISVMWASCFELFIANTAGLLSGYCLYRAISTSNNRTEVSSRLLWLSVLLGIISMFTYQNGFGCFFIPFIIHLLSARRNMRHIWIGIAVYFLVLVIYYILFRYNLKVSGVAASDRTGVHLAPWDKLKFFFTRPMRSAFHFTYLFNEKNLWGYLAYGLFFGCWILGYWIRQKGKTKKEQLTVLLVSFGLLALVYIPSLIVKENYASNRTLLAFKMAVFILVAESILFYLRKEMVQKMTIALISVLFVCNAFYNARYLFLKPVRDEYVQLRSFVEKTYSPQVRKYYFIRPREEFRVQQLGITRSWDEFGVPSSFFNWVPEFFIKQVIYEKTGDRAFADSIVVKHWLGLKEFEASGEEKLPNSVFIDVEQLLKQGASK